MSASKKKSIFESHGWKVGMKYLYGLGAAIVIMGALFKILHLPGANLALIVGLTTEAVIFFFSAFEPLPHDDKHYEWERVYPQLSEEYAFDEDGDETLLSGMGSGLAAPAGLKREDLEKINNLTPELFDSLSETVKGLRNNVQNLTEISDTSFAANSFTDKLKLATTKVDQLAVSYGTSVDTMKSFNEALGKLKTNQEQIQTETKNYQVQIQAVTKNLSSLNAIYEIELQDSQKHINSVTKFYGSISKVMQNLLDTSKDTDALRQEVAMLAKNMKTLNSVYGNMLTAMAQGVKS